MVTLWIHLLFNNLCKKIIFDFWAISTLWLKKYRDSIRAVTKACWFSDRDLNWGLKDLILSFILSKCSSIFRRFLSHHNHCIYSHCLTHKCCSDATACFELLASRVPMIRTSALSSSLWAWPEQSLNLIFAGLSPRATCRTHSASVRILLGTRIHYSNWHRENLI